MVNDAMWARAAQDYFDPQDPQPTCDICEEPQHFEDGPDDWNGETGCHLSCEEQQKEAWQCDDCRKEFYAKPYYTLGDEAEGTDHTGHLCPQCGGPYLEPDDPNDPRKPKE